MNQRSILMYADKHPHTKYTYSVSNARCSECSYNVVPVVSVVSGAICVTWSPGPVPVPKRLAIRLKQAEQHFVMSSVSSETMKSLNKYK